MNDCAASVSSGKPDISGVVARWPDAAETVYTACATALGNLTGNDAAPSFIVAYSGGLDSHVLLCAVQRFSTEHDNCRLRAIYVDHGLQKSSEAWGLHCERECKKLNVDYSVQKVFIDNDSSVSPEQAARNARYGALAGQMTEGDILLTAHHADDQAETLLLQLMRGAGVRGLASMPRCKSFASGAHARPLLSVRHQQLQEAAVALELEWVEDTSNHDTRFDRNFIRHKLLPTLKSRWPAAATSVSRAAGHCAEAASLLRDLAAIDVDITAPVVRLNELTSLTGMRRRNVLRQWIEHHGFVPPSQIKLQHIERDLIMAAPDSAGQVQFGSAQIVRHRQLLYIGEQAFFRPARSFVYQWSDMVQPLLIKETGQQLTRADIPLPWADGSVMLEVKSRQGGEKIKLSDRMHTQSVKSLLQQLGQPPWQRSRVPLVWCDDRLIGIVGVGFIDPSV